MRHENFSVREYVGAAVAAGILILSACAPKQIKTSAVPAPPAVAVSTVPAVNVGEANIRAGEFSSIPEIKTAYFEYNKANLTAATRAILRANADYLNNHPELDARVAGYCDERGTVEYNLALGQRRAKAVRDYYIRLGVDGERVATISYGKENPVCSEHAESCWAQNRRAETGVRSNAQAQASVDTNASAPIAAPAAAPATQTASPAGQ